MPEALPAPPQLDALHREIAVARKALTSAARARTPLQLLAHLTEAVEGLTATQHELVNYLLDEGASWDEVGAALDTSSRSAERRFPQRGRRGARGGRRDVRREAGA